MKSRKFQTIIYFYRDPSKKEEIPLGTARLFFARGKAVVLYRQTHVLGTVSKID